MIIRIIQLFVCSVFCAFLTQNISFGQLTSAQFDQITIESGLSSSNVRAICQDSSGYIWIGTADGLNKFDGVNFTVYNHVPDDSGSLSDNFINRLLVDRNGILWIGTLNGLNIFDPVSEIFYAIPLDNKVGNKAEQTEITSLMADFENNIWVGSSKPSGVFKIFKNHNKKKYSYTSAFFPLPDAVPDPAHPEYVFSICFSSKHKNTVWMGTKYGLYKILFLQGNNGKETVQWKKITYNPTQKNSLGNSFVNDVTEDNEGAVWINYFNGGIDRIFPSVNNVFEQDSIIHFYSETNNHKKSEFMSAIKDHLGNMWFGSFYDGLFKVTPSGNISYKTNINFLNFKNIPGNFKSLISNQINTLFEDQSGLLWIGTDVGISIYNRNKENYTVSDWSLFPEENGISITAIENDIDYLWLGTDDFGVAGVNKKTNQIFKASHSDLQPNSLNNNTVLAILKDHNGNIWVGTGSGLNLLKRKDIESVSAKESNETKITNLTVKRFYKDLNETNTIYEIYALLEDDENNLWIGSSAGVVCMNTDNLSILKKIDFGRGNAQLARCLFMDKTGHIWIGTEDGLNELNKKTGKIIKYYNNISDKNSLSSNRIASIYQTKDSIYWIGTSGGGLNKFDKQKKIFKNYTIENGLPNNVINAIVDDDNGNLWLSTNNGLSKFNIKEETFTNYNTNDGLKSNGFNIGAAFKSLNGEIFFGSIKGLNSFYPEKLTKNNFIPPVVITDFKIFDKSVFKSGLDKIKKSLLNDKFVQLEANQNFFSFEFAALNYINSSKNQYKYMLEGVDPDWINNGTRRFASYTNIDPGTYTFRVKGSNNDGIWNEKGASVTVSIKPPIYKTWWFRTIAAIIIAFLISFVTQLRIRAVHEKKERELAEHSSNMKQQFLANMSHEIRTPMNAILGMTRLMIDKDPRDDQKKYLNAIKQSSDNLLVIINDILDFSKIEAGRLELEFIPFSISKVLEGVYSTMQFKAAEKSLELTYKIDDKVPAAAIGDAVRLNEILINLVGNSLKFTHQGGVRITCRNLGSYSDTHGTVIPDILNIEFSVSDTGIGIPEDKLGTIFESFSQASSSTTRKYGGTGLGLTISKYLVELHGGKISVKSKEGSGTIFTLLFRSN
ncbi:MAG: two-component regulator propeller domain-containing protein [Bacteroidia bacterium]